MAKDLRSLVWQAAFRKPIGPLLLLLLPVLLLGIVDFQRGGSWPVWPFWVFSIVWFGLILGVFPLLQAREMARVPGSLSDTSLEIWTDRMESRRDGIEVKIFRPQIQAIEKRGNFVLIFLDSKRQQAMVVPIRAFAKAAELDAVLSGFRASS